MEKIGKSFEDLAIGDAAEGRYLVTEEVVQQFAEVSGDDNPVHLDEAYASTTPFGGRIAHGMLSAGYVSAVIGTKLPGYGSIYLSQTLRFRRPVKLGDEVLVRVAITALDAEKKRATLGTVCSVDGKTVLDGEAVVMPPRKGA
jgi:3-hydroxybutyryl-CoA dehydratase